MPDDILQGNNNETTREDNRIVKTPKSGGVSAAYEQSYETQVEQWNEYYKGTPYATAYTSDQGKLSTPFIEGRTATDAEAKTCVEKMLKQDWIMIDFRDKNNFRVTPDNVVHPVDFGQVYNKNSSRYYETYRAKVESELNQVSSEKTLDIKNDSRYQVLILLMKEQERLMKDYHLVDASNAKNGIRSETSIALRSNGKPYYQSDNKNIINVKNRIKAIGEMAKKLNQSLRTHPEGDSNMKSDKIHADLEILRSQMHGTGMLKGSFVTGRTNISRAIQIVAPFEKPKLSVVENIKKRLSFTR